MGGIVTQCNIPFSNYQLVFVFLFKTKNTQQILSSNHNRLKDEAVFIYFNGLLRVTIVFKLMRRRWRVVEALSLRWSWKCGSLRDGQLNGQVIDCSWTEYVLCEESESWRPWIDLFISIVWLSLVGVWRLVPIADWSGNNCYEEKTLTSMAQPPVWIGPECSECSCRHIRLLCREETWDETRWRRERGEWGS